MPERGVKCELDIIIRQFSLLFAKASYISYYVMFFLLYYFKKIKNIPLTIHLPCIKNSIQAGKPQ